MNDQKGDKYDELRAAIAAVREVNSRLLAILPRWRYDGEDAPAGGNPVATQKRAALQEKIAAFFRLHGKDGERAVAAFLDAMMRFSFEEFPRDWPEVWRMVFSSREIQWRLRRLFPDNDFFARVFHDEYWFFKAITPTARKERSRVYWEQLRKMSGFSRRVLARLGECAVKSLEGGIQPQQIVLAGLTKEAQEQFAAAMRRAKGRGGRGRQINERQRKDHNEVVTEMRRLKDIAEREKRTLTWLEIVERLKRNPIYAKKLIGVADVSWVSYAKRR